MPETPSTVELLELLERLAQGRLGQNPRNSDRPPSSDGLVKPAPKSLRKWSGHKPGGQPGHEGRTLRRVEAPHVVLRHEPKVCSAGRADLGDTVEVGPVRRQVFEIPPMKAEATEEMVTRRCGCGRATTADAPVGVDAPVQYGPWLAQGSVAAMTQRTGFAWRATS